VFRERVHLVGKSAIRGSACIGCVRAQFRSSAGYYKLLVYSERSIFAGATLTELWVKPPLSGAKANFGRGSDCVHRFYLDS
jgi:hypothetical protein